jgi:hypothetical protein
MNNFLLPKELEAKKEYSYSISIPSWMKGEILLQDGSRSHLCYFRFKNKNDVINSTSSILNQLVDKTFQTSKVQELDINYLKGYFSHEEDFENAKKEIYNLAKGSLFLHLYCEYKPLRIIYNFVHHNSTDDLQEFCNVEIINNVRLVGSITTNFRIIDNIKYVRAEMIDAEKDEKIFSSWHTGEPFLDDVFISRQEYLEINIKNI